jgi:hypothetical protein
MTQEMVTWRQRVMTLGRSTELNRMALINLYVDCFCARMLSHKLLKHYKQQIPGPESAIYRRLSAKSVPTFADRGCHVVSLTDSYGRNLGFLDWNRYFSFQVAPQLYSRGWVDSVRDTLLLRKSGSAGNRT